MDYLHGVSNIVITQIHTQEEECKEFKGVSWLYNRRFWFFYGPYITDGEYWRLITSNYIHDNTEHIITNLITALIVGTYIEIVLGHFWYFIIIIISSIWIGFGCALFDYYTATIGFSGIVFSMFGAQLGYMLIH